MWIKANPNLGQTVTYETYQLDVERAEKAPATRNDILAKRFGIPMEGYTYFFTFEETLPHRKKDFWGMPYCARCRSVPRRRLLLVHVPVSPVRRDIRRQDEELYFSLYHAASSFGGSSEVREFPE